MRRLIPIIFVLGLIVGGITYRSLFETAHDYTRSEILHLMDEFDAVLATSDFSKAEQILAEIESYAEDYPRIYLQRGKLSAVQNQPREALRWLDRIPPTESSIYVEGMVFAARLTRYQLGDLSETERRLLRALDENPDHSEALSAYSGLLFITGRRWEAESIDLALFQKYPPDVASLAWFSLPFSVIHIAPEATSSNPAIESDPLRTFATGFALQEQGMLREAEQHLRLAIDLDPKLIAAQVRLGVLLSGQQRWEELASWYRQLPQAALDWPESWMAIARLAEANQDRRSVVRCGLEALIRDPNQTDALNLLAQEYQQMGEESLSAECAERVSLIDRLTRTTQHLMTDPTDLVFYEEAAQLTEQLGRLWEAMAWSRLALLDNPSLVWAVQTVTRIEPELNPQLPKTIDSFYIARPQNLDAYPLKIALTSHPEKTIAPDKSPQRTPAHFQEIAATVNLNFQYRNGHDSAEEGVKMFEVNGGGIGILDFDADGWPDLYLTQGGTWPPPSVDPEETDRLYQNRLGTQYRDVTRLAGLEELQFSQGVTVTDFNQDGFSDIYVANIGKNTLFLNQGDGTFHEASDEAGLNETQWTTSCLFVDINGDALPDLYDVNYLDGDDVYEKVCPHEDGVIRVCNPKAFPSASDHLFLNAGNGMLQDTTTALGLDGHDFPGLGIVAFRSSDGELCLLVANDGTQNSFHRFARGPEYRFQDEAINRGLAFNYKGNSQACMGIAAGDVTGDGLLDFIVTNFYNEENCYYRQSDHLMFEDYTPKSILRETSTHQLGFGTQFLDADLDGWLDLVVANGHIVDRQTLDEPYQMPIQFYRNLGSGRFDLARSANSTGLFSQHHVGRALARVDWNRDRKDDFVMLPLDEPVLLGENQSERVGHSISLVLIGTSSERDAIGARVEIETDSGQHVFRALTAGDGFQASNERKLIFGLGRDENVRSLTIDWPSGVRQHWDRVAGDHEYKLVEGDPEVYLFPK